eukprot:SAG31_NODE_1401_length_8497_cov_4.386640_3_plen_67_part_00
MHAYAIAWAPCIHGHRDPCNFNCAMPRATNARRSVTAHGLTTNINRGLESNRAPPSPFVRLTEREL